MCSCIKIHVFFYRILEEISSSKSPTCNKFVKKHFENIQNFILSTAQNVAATSRGVNDYIFNGLYFKIFYLLIFL